MRWRLNKGNLEPHTPKPHHHGWTWASGSHALIGGGAGGRESECGDAEKARNETWWVLYMRQRHVCVCVGGEGGVEKTYQNGLSLTEILYHVNRTKIHHYLAMVPTVVAGGSGRSKHLFNCTFKRAPTSELGGPPEEGQGAVVIQRPHAMRPCTATPQNTNITGYYFIKVSRNNNIGNIKTTMTAQRKSAAR